MSRRRNVPEMIADKLPGKQVRIDDTGLRKRPQMEQIVDYIDTALMNNENEAMLADIRKNINEWMVKFPLYK